MVVVVVAEWLDANSSSSSAGSSIQAFYSMTDYDAVKKVLDKLYSNLMVTSMYNYNYMLLAFYLESFEGIMKGSAGLNRRLLLPSPSPNIQCFISKHRIFHLG